MLSPVRGLRPVRAEVVAVSNESQPGIATLPPAATVSEMAAKRPSSTFDTAAWLWPVSAAILATSSVLFSDIVSVFLPGQRHALVPLIGLPLGVGRSVDRV